MLNRKSDILLLGGLKKEIVSPTREVAATLYLCSLNIKLPTDTNRSREQEIRNPRCHELRETRLQGLLRSREHDAKRSSLEFKIDGLISIISVIEWSRSQSSG